jgi:S1-C subfamily serine protease
MIKSIQDSRGRIKSVPKETHKTKALRPSPGRAKIGWKWVLILIFALFFGGIAGVLVDSLLIPYMLTHPRFEKYQFLKPKEKQVIIKEKETTKIVESEEISEAIKKVKPVVVGIIPKEEIDKSPSLALKKENQGAGFIATSDGLIITNKFVVSDPNKIFVIFTADGASFESEEIFLDPASDLAFVKIQADNLPVVSFGVSDDLVLGQKIIALGNNLAGFQNFATQGVISNLNAPYQGDLNEENLDEIILSDAEINFKNQGGPLIDLFGKISGINIRAEREGKIINYAIPIDLVKKPLDDVIKNKEIFRLKIGIRYVTITPDFSEIKNFSRDQGIYLPEDADSVILESLAEKAGLRRGDIIFAVGEKEIREKQSFFRLMQDYKKGDEVEINYLRGEKEYKTKIKLE